MQVQETEADDKQSREVLFVSNVEDKDMCNHNVPPRSKHISSTLELVEDREVREEDLVEVEDEAERRLL